MYGLPLLPDVTAESRGCDRDAVVPKAKTLTV